MTLRIVQLGTARAPEEGVRLGTVRRPPRGVRKEMYATENWYDVWLPNLAPSQQLMDAMRADLSPGSWNTFIRKFKAEMNKPETSRVFDALAALSHSSSFSVGCYCDDESKCHRSVLRELFAQRGAKIA